MLLDGFLKGPAPGKHEGLRSVFLDHLHRSWRPSISPLVLTDAQVGLAFNLLHRFCLIGKTDLAMSTIGDPQRFSRRNDGAVPGISRGMAMTLHDIIKTLDARILIGTDQLTREVRSAFAADVMSDLLAFGTAGSLLLTRMTSPQVVRTSEILDIAAIVMVRGHVPTQEVLLLAGDLNIPILSTRYVLFETAGRLYEMGLRGLIDKVNPGQTIG